MKTESSTKAPKKALRKTDVMRSACPKCEGKGWYFVNEWIGTLQGRKDCSCKGKLPS